MSSNTREESSFEEERETGSGVRQEDSSSDKGQGQWRGWHAKLHFELLLAVDGKFDTKFLNTHLAHCSSLAHCRGCRAARKGCTVRCSHQVNLCGTRAEPWRAFGCVHTAGFILLAVLWQTLYM